MRQAFEHVFSNMLFSAATRSSIGNTSCWTHLQLSEGNKNKKKEKNITNKLLVIRSSTE